MGIEGDSRGNREEEKRKRKKRARKVSLSYPKRLMKPKISIAIPKMG
jgi:hypothetical protein